MPIFGGIEKGILEFLLSASEVLSVPKDSYFFHERVADEQLFRVMMGEPDITCNPVSLHLTAILPLSGATLEHSWVFSLRSLRLRVLRRALRT
jgi:hypothetical protein